MTSITPFNLGLYDARLNEWDVLLTDAQSTTLKDLFMQARSATEQALQRFVDLQRMSMVIMAANKVAFDNNITKYTVQIQQVTRDIQAAKAIHKPQPGLAEYFERTVDQVKAQANKEKAVYDLSLQVYSLGIAQFQRVLELIYQPRNSSFHYESIVDAFQYMADKIIPGLSELKSVRKLAPAIRKKVFAQSGDKLILYVEQYIDVLGKWEELAEAYSQLLNE